MCEDTSDKGQNTVSVQQWNLFIAQGILNKSPGFLTGYYCEDSIALICLLGIVQEMNVKTERVIGYWHGKNYQFLEEAISIRSSEDHSYCTSKCFPYYLHVWCDHANKVSCYLYDRGKQMKKQPPVCIVFHPEDILCSYIMKKSAALVPCSTKLTSSNKGVFNDENTSGHIISDVVGERIGHVLSFFLVEKCLPNERLVFEKQVMSSFTKALKGFICFFPRIIMLMFSFFHLIFDSSFPLAKKLLCVPNVSKHLMARCRRSHNVLKLERKNCFHKLIKYNAYAQHCLESLIGIVILYYVITNNLADSIASSVLDWADNVASRSDDLIKWLMGAPAGLKLNSQLTSMLGHFFIYHIYLWTGYLHILRTLLPWLLLFASWAGVLGISFQLCIIKDIISMLTLHIYCFYVYAARIFNLQVSALSSLWRLFRGKKWNTLRSRVDSAVYNTDQLFVGTLLFTVLLFLLPTTALYYTVFTGLRIVTLIAQGILTCLIEFISGTPVYSLLLYVFKPKWITGSVVFDVVQPSNPPSNLVLSMKTAKLPLSKMINITAPYLKEAGMPTYTWSELFSCVMSGKILYPWTNITDHDKRDQKVKSE